MPEKGYYIVLTVFYYPLHSYANKETMLAIRQKPHQLDTAVYCTLNNLYRFRCIVFHRTVEVDCYTFVILI